MIGIWVVANPDLVVAESVLAAVSSVVGLDQADTLSLAHVGIPPRILLSFVRVGEGILLRLEVVPHAASTFAVCGLACDTLRIGTGALGGWFAFQHVHVTS